MDNLMQKIESLAKRRGFIYPGSDIYGGLANSWDFGPLGVALKNNIRQEWLKWFVESREDVFGIDPAVIMNTKVWESSGHLKEFSDPLVEDKKTNERYRLDHLLEKEGINVSEMSEQDMVEKAQDTNLKSPKGNELAQPKQFNLMFKTNLGPIENDDSTVYLRPEIAQAMFVNFKNVFTTMRARLPFGIAACGKAFRNEITPGNYIYRTREFDLMEFEYFVQEKEWEKHFKYWLGQMHKWLEHCGINKKNLENYETPSSKLAHYSKRTVDIQYNFPFGTKELYGLAYRTDFDLRNHMEHSGEDLNYTDPNTNEKIVPHVIEPSFGLERTLLCVLLDVYAEDEQRIVIKFPRWMAPIKVAVFPLLQNDKKLVKHAREIFESILPCYVAQYDESGAIGRRYRRHDEIGTPLCITIDHDTLKDKSVTLRDRDSMKQIRVKIDDLLDTLGMYFDGKEFKKLVS